MKWRAGLAAREVVELAPVELAPVERELAEPAEPVQAVGERGERGPWSETSLDTT